MRVHEKQRDVQRKHMSNPEETAVTMKDVKLTEVLVSQICTTLQRGTLSIVPSLNKPRVVLAHYVEFASVCSIIV